LGALLGPEKTGSSFCVGLVFSGLPLAGFLCGGLVGWVGCFLSFV
jgi:small ligand-binding sensory domain FIST